MIKKTFITLALIAFAYQVQANDILLKGHLDTINYVMPMEKSVLQKLLPRGVKLHDVHATKHPVIFSFVRQTNLDNVGAHDPKWCRGDCSYDEFLFFVPKVYINSPEEQLSFMPRLYLESIRAINEGIAHYGLAKTQVVMERNSVSSEEVNLFEIFTPDVRMNEMVTAETTPMNVARMNPDDLEAFNAVALGTMALSGTHTITEFKDDLYCHQVATYHNDTPMLPTNTEEWLVPFVSQAIKPVTGELMIEHELARYENISALDAFAGIYSFSHLQMKGEFAEQGIATGAYRYDLDWEMTKPVPCSESL